MIRFQNDYGEGAHPLLLKRLAETNMEQTEGYGEDRYCRQAAQKIREQCALKEGEVHFFVGGTQTNLTVIGSVLRSHQGVIAADTGHIQVHETGAIEALGHKVLTVPEQDGKLTAKQVEEICDRHWKDASREHTVQPGMVYLSHPTECGTLYTKKELEELSAVCRRRGLPLFLDGARLGYGLTSPASELTLADIAGLTDLFYIGGTKVGALFGEAVVITRPELARDFRYLIKQKGALLAKGRLLGLQFDTLFTDELYFRISQEAVEKALLLKAAFLKKGYSLRYDSYTNQQFPILPEKDRKKLEETYGFTFWEEMGEGKSAVRFCTSWATTEEAIRQLVEDIEAL